MGTDGFQTRQILLLTKLMSLGWPAVRKVKATYEDWLTGPDCFERLQARSVESAGATFHVVTEVLDDRASKGTKDVDGFSPLGRSRFLGDTLTSCSLIGS